MGRPRPFIVLTNYERGDLGVLLDVLLADYLP